MTHPTRQEAPAGHRPGVFVEPDQARMPKPPADWIGVKLYDMEGHPIGLAYVPRSHDDGLLLRSAWEYFDARISVSGAVSPHPRLRIER